MCTPRLYAHISSDILYNAKIVAKCHVRKPVKPGGSL